MELGVEVCPEIFAAVEKLTREKLAVVAVDWDAGVEASFLLKRSRELTSSSSAFTIAVADAMAFEAAKRAGADFILTKPLDVERVKSLLLDCEEFRIRTNISFPPKPCASLARAYVPPKVEREKGLPIKMASSAKATSPLPEVRASSSDISLAVTKARPEVRVPPETKVSQPVTRRPTPTTLGNDVFGRAGIQGLFNAVQPPSRRPRSGGAYDGMAVARRVALGVLFFTVLYISVSPGRCEAVAGSVSKVCERALETTNNWFGLDKDRTDGTLGQENHQRPEERDSSKVRIEPVPDPYAVAVPPVSQSNAQIDAIAAPRPPKLTKLPESMQHPLDGAPVAEAPIKAPPLSLSPSWGTVTLSEEASQKLVVEKTEAECPEQAVRAGLEGSVVLQARLARDGTISNIQLVRGYLVLAQAAVQAVRQWKFRPYVHNGQAVEAEVYLTVDFKRP